MFNVLIIAPAFAPCPLVGSARMTSLSAFLSERDDMSISVICDDPIKWEKSQAKRSIPDKVTLIPVCNCANEAESIAEYKKKCQYELERKKIDLVISTVGPWYAYYFIAELCNKIKVPYIIDRRDVLFYDHRFIEHPFQYLRKTLSYQLKYKRIEHDVLSTAVAVVDVTEGWKLQSIKLTHDDRKCHLIPNGYEEIDKANSYHKETIKKDYKYFVVAGKFFDYSPDMAQKVVRAIDNLNKQGVNCKLVHIGKEETLLEEFCLKEKISTNNFIQMGIKTYPETINIIQNSECGVLVYDYLNGLGTKVYDYIASGVPIVACLTSKRLAIWEFLQKYNRGFPCKTVKDLEDAFLKVLSGKQVNNNSYEFSRLYSNQKYYQLIKDVIAKGMSANGNFAQ